jgi:hypothetical protein
VNRIVVIEGVTYEILPLDNLSSPLCGTASQLITQLISIEEAEHEERVLHAKHARSHVKRPFGKDAK